MIPAISARMPWFTHCGRFWRSLTKSLAQDSDWAERVNLAKLPAVTIFHGR